MTLFSKSKKTTHYRRGLWAEYLAAMFLTLKGYRIRSMRYKTKVGEIDIIASRGKVLTFIEVKLRHDEVQALSAVRPSSQKRIRRAAEQYMASQKSKESYIFGDHQVRFDVIGITSHYQIRHITNAF